MLILVLFSGTFPARDESNPHASHASAVRMPIFELLQIIFTSVSSSDVIYYYACWLLLFIMIWYYLVSKIIYFVIFLYMCLWVLNTCMLIHALYQHLFFDSLLILVCVCVNLGTSTTTSWIFSRKLPKLCREMVEYVVWVFCCRNMIGCCYFLAYRRNRKREET